MQKNSQVSDEVKDAETGGSAPRRLLGAGRARSVVPALTVLAAAGLLGGCAASSGRPAASGTASRAVTAPSTGSPTAGSPSASSQSGGAATGSPGTASAGGGASARGSSAETCAGSSTAASASVSSGAPALAAVQFADPAHGWVAGAGRILATSDGGRTWTRQYSGTADLSQVDFADAAHGWAVGQGTLLRTTDGGARWTALNEPRAGGRCLAVGSVHFVSAARGYAIAGVPGSPGTSPGGKLLVTDNGGTTWSQVAGAPTGAQSACFGTAQDGYVGASGRIWRTTDAGKTWALAFTEPQASPVGQAAGGASGAGSSGAGSPGNGQPAGDTPELECAGQSAAWVLFLGDGAAMMHSPYLAYATEQGTTWHGVLEETMLESALRPKLHLPPGPGSEPGPFSVISPSAAAFVGYTPPEGYGAAPLALASGGGTTLASAGNVPAINQPLAAAFLTPSQGWVVGENLKSNTFAVEATTNGGHTWTTQYTAP